MSSNSAMFQLNVKEIDLIGCLIWFQVSQFLHLGTVNVDSDSITNHNKIIGQVQRPLVPLR